MSVHEIAELLKEHRISFYLVTGERLKLQVAGVNEHDPNSKGIDESFLIFDAADVDDLEDMADDI